MFDLGDEFTLESYRIPWLIWIQLLVLFLLIVLLYCFTIFVSDPSDYASTATTAVVPTIDSPTTSRFLLDDVQQVEEPSAKHDSTATSLVINRRQNTQGGQNRSIKGEVLAGTSRRIMSGEEISEREGLSRFHLCHYFQLAKVAFLKCLGLDSCDSPPPTRKQRKRKDS